MFSIDLWTKTFEIRVSKMMGFQSIWGLRSFEIRVSKKGVLDRFVV